jgi:hypothetical protein
MNIDDAYKGWGVTNMGECSENLAQGRMFRESSTKNKLTLLNTARPYSITRKSEKCSGFRV